MWSGFVLSWLEPRLVLDFCLTLLYPPLKCWDYMCAPSPTYTQGLFALFCFVFETMSYHVALADQELPV